MITHDCTRRYFTLLHQNTDWFHLHLVTARTSARVPNRWALPCSAPPKTSPKRPWALHLKRCSQAQRSDPYRSVHYHWILGWLLHANPTHCKRIGRSLGHVVTIPDNPRRNMMFTVVVGWHLMKVLFSSMHIETSWIMLKQHLRTLAHTGASKFAGCHRISVLQLFG